MSKANGINIKHLARLSSLPVDETEEKDLESQLEETLETISKLNEVDTSKVQATSQVTGLTNVFRKDEVDSDNTFSQEQALANAIETHDGYVVVPAVINS